VPAKTVGGLSQRQRDELDAGKDRAHRVLAGNHDSAALFAVFALLLGDESQVRFVSRARHPRDGGIIDIDSPEAGGAGGVGRGAAACSYVDFIS